jgi:2'-5' RNA ligase
MEKKSGSFRLFVGVPPGEPVLTVLLQHIERMKQYSWSHSVRWIERNNIHMTLKFLGNCDPDKAKDLVRGFQSRLNFPVINYQIKSISIFPFKSRPVVIAALVQENESLIKLARQLEHIAQNYGFARETKEFRGHFTLGRCHKNFPRGIAIETENIDLGEELGDLQLYRSETRSSGAVYTAIARISREGLYKNRDLS